MKKAILILGWVALGLDAAEDGLLHRWHFDQAKDGVIPASVGTPAKYTGAARPAEVDGPKHLHLGEKDRRAWVTDDFKTTTVPKGAITVEAWVNPLQPMKWGAIAAVIQDNGNYEHGWLLGYRDRRFTFTVSSQGSPKFGYQMGPTAFQEEYWYHVVGTYDPDRNATCLYVNGKLEATHNRHSGSISYPGVATLEIGSYKDNDENHQGAINLHEVSVYDKALDSETIAKRFQARKHEFRLPAEPLEFFSAPALRWQKRNALGIEWKLSQAMPVELVWKAAGAKHENRIRRAAAKEFSITLNGLPPEGEFLYQIVAQGAGQSEFASPWYKFDTSFYYRLPVRPALPSPFADDAAMQQVQAAAKRILAESGVQQGYALVLGAAGGRLAYELARQTELQVVIVEPDAAKAQAARAALVKAGLYGIRASVHQSGLDELPYGPYFANLIVSGSLIFDGQLPGKDAGELMRVLRPAGGVAMLCHVAGNLTPIQMRDWFKAAGADCNAFAEGTVVWAAVKRGKLEGAGDWTHQYGSADNTTTSRDDLVRGEMGILWWGEPGPRPMPDRGGRNPAPLAANGRMFIQGDRVLFGVDAYNGTVLWTFFSPEMRRSNLPRDGSNMVATDNTLFVTIGNECIALDAQTGQRRTAVNAAQGRDWGWVSAGKDQLLMATVKTGSAYKADSGEWYDAFAAGQVERVVSDALVSHDPATGKEQWAYRGGAVMNSTLTVTDDTIYFVESRNKEVAKSPNSRISPVQLTAQHLVALDRESGKKLWAKPVDFSKCENMLYLVHAQGTLVATGSDRNKVYHTYALDVSSPALRFAGENAEVPELWNKSRKAAKDHHGGHLQHPLVIGDVFYSDSIAYDLRKGDTVRTDLPQRRGCGNMAASNHSMFYRHYNHGIWDIQANTKTELLGIRSGCWLGIIPAQGLMLAPESSSGCSCTHSIQTSAAWVPRAALKKPKE